MSLKYRLTVFSVYTLLAITLVACGFRPMYGSTDSRPVAREMSGIKIALIPDRSGQELRNHLLDRLTPRGQPAEASYRLTVQLDEEISNIAIERTGLPTRANLEVDARYQLVSTEDGAPVLRGSARVTSSYNLLDADFSTLTSENDARSRALESIADQIRTRLAVYFATQTATAAGG